MLKHNRLPAWIALALGIICVEARGDAPAAPQAGFSLTIYSTADPATFDPQDIVRQENMNPYYAQQNPLPGYGIVRENREIKLDQGDNTIRFTDVASGIDPTTVSFQSLTAPDAAGVLEQNYEYDLVSADKLMGKYLGKQVEVVRQGPGSGPAQVLTGTLLSFDASNLVVQTAAGGVQVITRGPEIEGIQLASADASLITKPTLVWKIQSTQAGPHMAQVKYQTDGLTWRADYNVTVNADDNAADIGAWVTILNQSGARYPDAKLKLVAGDVQRIKPPQQNYRFRGMMNAQADMAAAPAGFAEKSFFEYHLYTLGRTTSLSNNSTKQIELFAPKLNVPVDKTYVYYGVPEQLRFWSVDNPNMDQNLGTDSNKKVDVYLLLTNSESNGLGIPLPAGRIRVYKRDEADGSREFIGEDVIQHTPKDENVMIKLGSAFDIVGERRQTDFNANFNGHVITESFEIKLRNHKKEAVHVIVKENLYRWNNWEITACSDKWEKQDFRTIHIPVDVPADGEKTVTYSVKYTW
ncbi:MAG TPA: hypothetical protein VGG44_02215 [Tepidisphaeraceae bacterium]|jgi:hypothetical protein